MTHQCRCHRTCAPPRHWRCVGLRECVGPARTAVPLRSPSRGTERYGYGCACTLGATNGPFAALQARADAPAGSVYSCDRFSMFASTFYTIVIALHMWLSFHASLRAISILITGYPVTGVVTGKTQLLACLPVTGVVTGVVMLLCVFQDCYCVTNPVRVACVRVFLYDPVPVLCCMHARTGRAHTTNDTNT